MVHEKSAKPSEDQTSINLSLDLSYEAIGLFLGTEGILAGVGPIAFGVLHVVYLCLWSLLGSVMYVPFVTDEKSLL